MNVDEKLNKIEEEEEEEFSLSEDIALSTRQHTSSESSRIVEEKKKRKFKPAKFISKHLKIKKDDKKVDSGDTSETRSEDSTKSPKLGILKRSIAKRFSRKKKFQVSPMDSGESSQPDEPLNNEIDLAKEIEKLSKSYPNISISDQSENIEEKKINEDSLELKKSIQTIDNKESSPKLEQISSPMSENKKVQLQITISGKKIEKVQTTRTETMSTETIVSSKATDKASSPLQYYKSQTDIILPSVNTAVRVNKIREQFFNVMVSQSSNSTNKDNENVYMQHQTKSISSDALSQSVSRSTLIQTTSEGFEGNELSEELIKSSVNSIISSAKDLSKLDEKIEFPQNLPELKIFEETDRKENDIENKVEADIDEIQGKSEKVPELTEIKDIELGPSEQVISDEMKKSKIPVNRLRSSSENNIEKDLSQSTVHTQEAHKPYHLNLTSSPSVDELKTTFEVKSEEIKFEVGTAVRPPKILSANSTSISPIIITEMESESSNVQDDEFHSPKSETNASLEKHDSRTRRKIAYIPQLTVYTPEEQELLKSNIIANSESFDLPSLPPDTSMFPVFDDSLLSNMTPSTPEKRECLYKILVIGELGTGKTSFIKRYVHQFFSQNYRATIGVDFALKVLNWDQSTIIRLQLWDIAGQERFGNMTRVYYKEAVGAFIVFDVTRPATFDAVNKWKTDLDSKVQLPDGSPIPCILLANKCDQPKQGLVALPAKMDEYCKENGFTGWFETSAKENTNIDESAKALVSKILINDKLIHNDMVDGERLILNAEDVEKPKNFCSC
ncbi:unnamed protein product [Chironomus riparius]|uniref:Rab32 n=1 Tax=Chironomus riparius TaxID=315576 RepID=A0A9N9RMJ8_9DIPT|nr:unnamed protein product [Chironomus riparius]